jgi:hypothetical protein
LISGTGTFYGGIEALAPRTDKCLNVNDDSVEVWCVTSATSCHVVIEVRMKFSVSHGLLFFLKHFSISISAVDRLPERQDQRKAEMIP